MKLTPETKDAIHAMRDDAHTTLRRAARTCSCDECQDHLDALNQIGQSNDDTDRLTDADIIERSSNSESVLDILNRLQAKGLLSSQQAQMAAAAIAVRPMYNNVAH